MKKRKFLLFFCLFFFASAAACILFGCYCNHVIGTCSSKCYSDIDLIPVRDVALVPGTAKYFKNGMLNTYFTNRIDAASELYKRGKIKHILVSGDNSRKEYDEPTEMKNALVEMGVPANAVTLDYAGFRTLDSIVRAKAIFGCTEITIVSQQFHAERAIYIAEKHDIDAIGFAAVDPQQRRLKWRTHTREFLARTAAWLDVNIINREPKFYGEFLPIIPREANTQQ